MIEELNREEVHLRVDIERREELLSEWAADKELEERTQREREGSWRELAKMAKEKARAAVWLDTAKQLIAPAYASHKVTREAYKGLLSATMKHPFDTFDKNLPNWYALKAFLDRTLQEYDWTPAEKKALDSAFTAVLTEFRLQSRAHRVLPKYTYKNEATQTKRSSSQNESME